MLRLVSCLPARCTAMGILKRFKSLENLVSNHFIYKDLICAFEQATDLIRLKLSCMNVYMT